MKVALNHVVESIKNAKLNTEPFPYLYIENVFPEDFYKKLVENVPDKSAKGFRKLSSTYNNRFVMDLYKGENGGESIKSFDGFWNYFQKYFIKQPDVVNAFLDKYRQYLGPFEMKDTFVNARITKDMKGYSIGPHRDRKNKMFSVIFYLPEEYDEALAKDWGTGLYVPKNKDMIHTDKHYKFDDFDLFKTAECKPNTLFSWCVIEDSYHGVTPTTIAGERTTIGYFLKAYDKLASTRVHYKQ